MLSVRAPQLARLTSERFENTEHASALPRGSRAGRRADVLAVLARAGEDRQPERVALSDRQAARESAVG
jgi:hypothetical protein